MLELGTHEDLYRQEAQTGTLYINLAHERAWALTHLEFDAVTVDFSRTPTPDWLLSQLLSTFEPLTHPTSGVNWKLTGTEALSENSHRLLVAALGKR